MGKFLKVRMRVSIASESWSYQPDQVALVDADLAKAWVRNGHAEKVGPEVPLTDFNSLDGLADLDAAEALRRRCTHCEHRARYILRNKPYCARHFRGELGG